MSVMWATGSKGAGVRGDGEGPQRNPVEKFSRKQLGARERSEGRRGRRAQGEYRRERGWAGSS